MTQQDKEQIEKELYQHIDRFTGNREVHTPSLVNDLLKMFAEQLKQERNKAIDEFKLDLQIKIEEEMDKEAKAAKIPLSNVHPTGYYMGLEKLLKLIQ